MNIRYLNNSDAVDWQVVSNLFIEAGWGARAPEQIKSAFQKSSFVRFAYVDDQLVGVGRTVDDGQYYAWIVDLAILPKFQEKGIGRYILAELEKDLEPYISTMLTAAPGKSGFYEKLGWIKQSAAYIWPRSEEQKRAFSEEL